MAQRNTSVEPWLRGTRAGIPSVVRAVLHSLDLTREDFGRWVWPLGAAGLNEQLFGLPALGFQVRHIARSLDRLLSYAEGKQLTESQRRLLATECESATLVATRLEFETALESAENRILALPFDQMESTRHVGVAGLPVTLGGLLVHLADHSQRHAGQAVTTAKLVAAIQAAERS